MLLEAIDGLDEASPMLGSILHCLFSKPPKSGTTNLFAKGCKQINQGHILKIFLAYLLDGPHPHLKGFFMPKVPKCKYTPRVSVGTPGFSLE